MRKGKSGAFLRTVLEMTLFWVMAQGNFAKRKDSFAAFGALCRKKSTLSKNNKRKKERKKTTTTRNKQTKKTKKIENNCLLFPKTTFQNFCNVLHWRDLFKQELNPSTKFKTKKQTDYNFTFLIVNFALPAWFSRVQFQKSNDLHGKRKTQQNEHTHAKLYPSKTPLPNERLSHNEAFVPRERSKNTSWRSWDNWSFHLKVQPMVCQSDGIQLNNFAALC